MPQTETRDNMTRTLTNNYYCTQNKACGESADLQSMRQEENNGAGFMGRCRADIDLY